MAYSQKFVLNHDKKTKQNNQKQLSEEWKWIQKTDDRFCLVEKSSFLMKQIVFVHTVKDIDTEISRLWKERQKDFPGSLAVSLMKENLSLIKTNINDIRIFPKTDGTRYLLLCTNHQQLGQISVLIDRNYNMYLVETPFDIMSEYSGKIDKTYARTFFSLRVQCFHSWIFDGELIRKKDNITFEIFDCIVADDEYVGNLSHEDRMQKAKRCDMENSKYYNESGFKNIDDMLVEELKIEFKNYISYENALVHMEESLKNNNNSDGIILFFNSSPYVSGQDKKLFKLKPQTQNTVDLLIEYDSTKCMYNFSVPDHINKRYMLIFFLPQKKMKTNFSYLFKETNDIHDHVCECEWNFQNKKWIPKKIRFDKKIPNNYDTFCRTLTNIEENILLSDLSFLKKN